MGRTPPPGGGRSHSPAAASSVKVDSSDVQKLSRLLGDAAGNAEKLSKAMAKFDSGPLSKLNSEVQSLRGALSGVGVRGATTRSVQGGNATGTRIANQHAAPISGTEHIATGTGGGSYLTGHWAQPLGRVGGTAAFLGVEAATRVAGLMAGHMPDAINRSYLANRWQIQTGGPATYAGQVALGKRLSGMFGGNTLGYTDTTQAAALLMGTGAISGGLGQSRIQSASFGAALNPTQGALGGAQMTARVFTPQNFYRARLAGINQMAGGKQNLQTFMDQVINRYEATVGRKLTQAEIQSGNQPGMPLYLTLVGLGFADDTDRQNLLVYWSARNKTGKTGVAALSAAHANTGLFKQAQQTQNARGQALSQMDVGGMRGMMQGLRAKQEMYRFLGDAADTPFGQVVTDATGSMSVFNSELSTANKLLGVLVGGSVLRKLVQVFTGGAAVETAATVASRAGSAGRLAESGGALSRVGGALDSPIGRVFEKLGPALAVGGLMLKTGSDVYRSSSQDVHSHASALTTGRHAVTRELSDVGGFFGQFDPVGGLLSGASHVLGAFGDSNRKSPPLSDNGVTWPQLEKIARSGPPHIVTSTTSGHHANNSYHYKGQAIDLAAPGGGSDTPGLLAINRFWASRYGRKLKELIYAGPGGVCIKDGKVVNGMAFYGASTMAEHHNHVHVAATPASLAGAGGGVPVGAAPGNNAGTDSVGASPASSSGGFGGTLIGGLFGSSSGGSLLAALTSLGGGGSGYATAAMPGGTASNGAAVSGRAASGAGVSVGRAPVNVTGNVALARKMAAQRGWTGKEWDALYAVWNQESGFNTTAGTPARAYGIPQALPGNKMASAGADWISNPKTQIRWGLGYIEGRYHDPLGALAHKHATDSNLGSHALMAQPGGWYETGKWKLIRDEIAQLHRGEMVVPASTAEKLRQAISSPASAGGPSGGSGRRRLPVQLVFMVQRGTDAEMRQAARKFVQYVEDDSDIELVSSS